MKCKFFIQSDTDEKSINAWLDKNKTKKVIQITQSQAPETGVTIIIFYED
jgi:hypothetical protein